MKISRSTVFEMARGNVLPGDAIHDHGETFPTCCPPRKLSARTGKLPVCPCTAIVFQRSDLRLVPRRLNNFLNLLPSSTVTCTRVNGSQNGSFVHRALLHHSLFLFSYLGYRFYRILDFPRVSMLSLVQCSLLLLSLYPNGKLNSLLDFSL